MLSRDILDEIKTSAGQEPILHHLNADSSWLIQIPCFPSSSETEGGKRHFFNIVVDPWLLGPQSDVAGWFSKQWHAEEPAFTNFDAVEKLSLEVGQTVSDSSSTTTDKREKSAIDAVVISHEFTDHCHKETLLDFPKNMPVFANDEAVRLIRSWDHFSNIHEIPAFDADWQSISKPPLPKHISISRLRNGGDFLYFHSAVVIAFQSQEESSGKCLIYTPHGIESYAANPFADCTPPLQAVALLHGLHDVSIPWSGPFKSGNQQLNLGAHNALKLQRQIHAKYWLSTHDEVKTAYGLVSWLLRRKVITLDEAMSLEAENAGVKGDDVKVLNMDNGQSMVLK